ncbi:MAG: glycosyltransferase [bacterium]
MLQIYPTGNPTVSIILPTFNRATYLNRCIDSVLQQSYKDWELLIIDDGSIDETQSILQPYSEKHNNIRLMRHNNKGITFSLNTGILASAGAFITSINSDDEYTYDHIEKRVSYMNDHPSIDLIHGGTNIIGNPFVPDKHDIEKSIHLDECYIGATFFGKRQVFIELDGFINIPFAEDSEFMDRAVKKFTVERVHFPTYRYYRDTPDSICNNIRTRIGKTDKIKEQETLLESPTNDQRTV